MPRVAVWPVPDWATASPESQGLDGAALENLRKRLEQCGTRQALVIRHARIVAEWYWDGRDGGSPLPVYSVTKSVANVAVGMLARDGKLRLDEPAADFVPGWESDERRAVTLRHLLSMTSGLKPEETSYFLRQDQVERSLGQPLESRPGTVWRYNNIACNVLSTVVTRASGEEMGAFLRRRLFEPLGIRTAFLEQRGGKTLAYMGLHISARDLARVGLLYLREGEWNGKRLLSAEWVRESTRPSQALNPAYGLLWWIGGEPLPKGTFYANGLYGNYMVVVPSRDMIVIRLIGTGAGRLTNVTPYEFMPLALAAVRGP